MSGSPGPVDSQPASGNRKPLWRFPLLPLPSPLPWDGLVAAMLSIGGLVAYVSTLAPTVLDGDAALFQYTPSVLGVTYPTGYPTYILLSRLWTLLVPVGSIAYRVNLFSAVCGALALAFLYPALRRLLESRPAALLATLIFATLPTYWRWATESKIYTLHILFLSGILFLLTRCNESASQRVNESAKQGTPALRAHLPRKRRGAGGASVSKSQTADPKLQLAGAWHSLLPTPDSLLPTF